MPLKQTPKALKILPCTSMYRNFMFFLLASLYLCCFRNVHLLNTMQHDCEELDRFCSNISPPPASCEVGAQHIHTDLLLRLLCFAMFTCAHTDLSKWNLILTFMAVLTWHQVLLLRHFAGGWGCHTDTSRAWSDSRQGLQKKPLVWTGSAVRRKLSCFEACEPSRVQQRFGGRMGMAQCKLIGTEEGKGFYALYHQKTLPCTSFFPHSLWTLSQV